MTLRAINPNDINKLKIIHEKFYKDEFEFPDFFNKYLSAFVVIDEYDNIITGGGVRVIAEAVAITNKSYPINERRLALYDILMASACISNVNGFGQLHAFIQDDKWLRHLKKVGFNETAGKSIVLNL
jgi:hypothetical protein